MNESPLSEASAESLQELFDRDPLTLTDHNIERIVAELRAQRDRWQIAERKGRAKAQPAPSAISLEDIGL